MGLLTGILQWKACWASHNPFAPLEGSNVGPNKSRKGGLEETGFAMATQANSGLWASVKNRHTMGGVQETKLALAMVMAKSACLSRSALPQSLC